MVINEKQKPYSITQEELNLRFDYAEGRISLKKWKGNKRMKASINKIIKDFDFEKVHKAMQALNWGWISTNMKVPSIRQLMLCAQKLLQTVSKMGVGCSLSTGGFRATKINNEDMEEALELEFILTESFSLIRKQPKIRNK